MYNVDIFKGYNGKTLIGLPPEQIIKIMPNYEETLWGFDGARRDFSYELIAYYDKRNEICTSITFINTDTEVYIDDVQFMGIKEEELVTRLKNTFPSDDIFTDGEFYTYPKKALCFFITEGCVGGITVGAEGFFDFVMDKTFPPNEWKI